MTPQELKNSILQLAIQGKLVPQDPSEGTGEEVCLQIQEEKTKLIKKGEIKNQKPLPEITEDEIPFDIPESWFWIRLGECTSYTQTKKKITPKEIGPDMWSLDLEDIEKESGKVINVCRAGDRKITGDKVLFSEGQVLYSKLRPYLKKILVAPSDGCCTPELVPFTVYGGVFSEYVAYVLRSPHVDYIINSVTYGVKMPRVGTETMANLLVPLPPIEEQRRILEKIEELLPLVDQYEQAWTKLEEFNARFPMDMQKSILQMAIQGKLVPQDASEGTGEELYQKIQEEKAKLIKEGKIKKRTVLPEISEDEILFEIPANWKWIRVGDVGSWSAGATPSRANSEYYGGGVPWLKTGDLNDGLISEVPESITEKALKETSLRLNPVGSVLMAMYGATIGKLGINTIPLTTNQACCACIPYSGIYNRYLFFFLMAQRTFYIKLGEGGAQPNISKEKIIATIFPLPPLAEQKRIVEKIEELLPLCEQLNKEGEM